MRTLQTNILNHDVVQCGALLCSGRGIWTWTFWRRGERLANSAHQAAHRPAPASVVSCQPPAAGFELQGVHTGSSKAPMWWKRACATKRGLRCLAATTRPRAKLVVSGTERVCAVVPTRSRLSRRGRRLAGTEGVCVPVNPRYVAIPHHPSWLGYSLCSHQSENKKHY